MSKNRQNKFIDWALRSKVGGGNGSQDLGPLVLKKIPLTYIYAHNYHTT